MPRWPKVAEVIAAQEKKKRGRPFAPDKSTQTTQINPDLQPLVDWFESRESLAVELKDANARALVTMKEEINNLRGDVNEFKFALQELKTEQTSKSWVKELLANLGLWKVKQ